MTQSFEELAAAVAASARRGGIGTLGEKTLHRVLKHYYGPDPAWHEVRIGPYVADLLTPDGVMEIQTRSFAALRKKLAYLLAEHRVTLVCPVAHVKWLSWVDPATGEVSARRKSPKTGTPADVFFELYGIRELLPHPNLSLRVVLLDIDETRFLNGWGRGGKRGSSRCDRIPLALAGELNIRGQADYLCLLPDALPAVFTTKDLRSAARLSPAATQRAVSVLMTVGAIRRTGRSGRLYTYERAVFPAEPVDQMPASALYYGKEPNDYER